MLDMGFEPQIMKILLDVRPDRQTVMTRYQLTCFYCSLSACIIIYNIHSLIWLLTSIH